MLPSIPEFQQARHVSCAFAPPHTHNLPEKAVRRASRRRGNAGYHSDETLTFGDCGGHVTSVVKPHREKVEKDRG